MAVASTKAPAKLAWRKCCAPQYWSIARRRTAGTCQGEHLPVLCCGEPVSRVPLLAVWQVPASCGSRCTRPREAGRTFPNGWVYVICSSVVVARVCDLAYTSSCLCGLRWCCQNLRDTVFSPSLADCAVTKLKQEARQQHARTQVWC